MRRKSLLSLILAPTMLITLAACDGGKEKISSTSPLSGGEQSISSPLTTPSVPTPADSGYSDPAETTIAALAAKKATELRNLYRVSGVVENITNVEKGNFTLTDPDTLDSIAVFGLDKDWSLFLNVEEGQEPDAPTTFETIGLAEGDKLTMVGYFKLYAPDWGSPTPELIGYYESKVSKDDYEIDITLNKPADTTGGTVTIDKTKAHYGETVTLTLSPAAEKTAMVLVNGVEVAATENTVTIPVGLKNVIDVSFVDPIVFTELTYKLQDDTESMNAKTAVNTAVDGQQLTAILKAGKVGDGDDIIASTQIGQKIFCVSDTAGPVKMGTGSATGSLTIQLKVKVTKVTIRAVAWSGKEAKLTVNGVTKDLPTGSIEASAYADYVFEFAATDSIVIETAAKPDPRIVFNSITFTK